MKEQLLVRAIAKLQPNAEFSFTDGDYSTIKWDKLDGTAPSVAEIESAMKIIEAENQNLIAKTAADKVALLARLGITADEAALLVQ